MVRIEDIASHTAAMTIAMMDQREYREDGTQREEDPVAPSGRRYDRLKTNDTRRLNEPTECCTKDGVSQQDATDGDNCKTPSQFEKCCFDSTSLLQAVLAVSTTAPAEYASSSIQAADESVSRTCRDVTTYATASNYVLPLSGNSSGLAMDWPGSPLTECQYKSTESQSEPGTIHVPRSSAFSSTTCSPVNAFSSPQPSSEGLISPSASSPFLSSAKGDTTPAGSSSLSALLSLLRREGLPWLAKFPKPGCDSIESPLPQTDPADLSSPRDGALSKEFVETPLDYGSTQSDSLAALASALSACLGHSSEDFELGKGLETSIPQQDVLPVCQSAEATSELPFPEFPPHFKSSDDSIHDKSTYLPDNDQHEGSGTTTTPDTRSPTVLSLDAETYGPKNCDGSGFNPDGTIELSFFKVIPCRNSAFAHDRKNCPFYHSLRDKRRHPVFYKAEQCSYQFDADQDKDAICPFGERCDKCHNRQELLYHPDIYRQRFCSSYNYLECHRGRYCAFAHTRDEIRCQLFSIEDETAPGPEFFMMRFKTLWCPYGIQHDWHGCLYAHTYQDCRRSPWIGYGSEPCPYWQKDLHSADYQKRCPYGPRCPYSHGSKEQLYHPAYYKTMPCADYRMKRSCPRRELCAFYHDPEERRIPSQAAYLVPSRGLQDHEPTAAALSVERGAIPRLTYDYGRSIPAEVIRLLQPSFMRPPLFNLDDFEAFGHNTRPWSGDRRRDSTYVPQFACGSESSNVGSHRSVFPGKSRYSNSTARQRHTWDVAALDGVGGDGHTSNKLPAFPKTRRSHHHQQPFPLRKPYEGVHRANGMRDKLVDFGRRRPRLRGHDNDLVQRV